MEYYIIEEVLYTPNANRFIYVVTGRDNEYVGEGKYTYPEAVIELAGLYGVSEEEVRKVVGDYFIFNAIYLVSFSVQDMYNKVDEFLKENDLKNYKEGIELLQDEGYEENLKDTGAYGYVEENIKDIKKVYSEYSENDYGDDVYNMNLGSVKIKEYDKVSVKEKSRIYKNYKEDLSKGKEYSVSWKKGNRIGLINDKGVIMGYPISLFEKIGSMGNPLSISSKEREIIDLKRKTK